MRKPYGGRVNELESTTNIEESEPQVAEVQEETERAICDDYAKAVWMMYNSFIDAGFSRRQAFELVLMMVSDH